MCVIVALLSGVVFFFNDTATTEIYTLSLHDALPISPLRRRLRRRRWCRLRRGLLVLTAGVRRHDVVAGVGRNRRGDERRLEEHTPGPPSPQYLVCRLLLEKKKDSRRYISRQLEHLSS